MDNSSRSVRDGITKPRLSQVYVEIPRSPLVVHSHQSTNKSGKKNASSNLSIALFNSLSSKMTPLKRKNGELDSFPSKKLKQPDTVTVDPMKAEAPCHHCRKRKPLTDIVQCTRVTNHGSRCRASYCDNCLHKKYDLHLDAFKTRPSAESEQGHIPGDYIFSCPRCDGRCTCAPCRKKEVANISESQPNVDLKEGIKTQANNVDKPKPQKKEALVPKPFWVRLPSRPTRKEFEDRLYIREFILRFNPILNLGIKNLEELDDPNSLHDSSAKAILLALLDTIAIEAGNNVKEIQLRLKTVQGLGLNWSKIIPVVEDLRSLVPKDHPFHTLPTIEKTKDSTYSMRGNRSHGVDADSLLPLLLYLINIVCNGGSIREELEVGNEQTRKARVDYHAALKNEHEKWNDLKQSLMETKPNIQSKKELKAHKWTNQYQEADAKHKGKVNDLQCYFRLELNSCAPRFEPLGTDTDGRIYYLPSSLGPFRGKKDRLPSLNERLGFRKWSWFIAVYGKPGAQIRDTEFNEVDDDPDGDDESGQEDWWGFADVSEIRKLSKWLASRAGGADELTADEGTPLKGPPNSMKSLAKGIAEFADFIDWRLKRST